MPAMIVENRTRSQTIPHFPPHYSEIYLKKPPERVYPMGRLIIYSCYVSLTPESTFTGVSKILGQLQKVVYLWPLLRTEL